MPGTFTITTQLMLAARHRRRLEHLVRSQGRTPAEVVSELLGILSLPAQIDPPANEALDRVPILLYLAPEQRDLLQAYAAINELSVAAVVSAMLAEYLEPIADPPAIQHPDVDPNAVLRGYRRELMRLRARRDMLRDRVPDWLNEYIADLEAEVKRMTRTLERR